MGNARKPSLLRGLPGGVAFRSDNKEGWINQQESFDSRRRHIAPHGGLEIGPLDMVGPGWAQSVVNDMQYPLVLTPLTVADHDITVVYGRGYVGTNGTGSITFALYQLQPDIQGRLLLTKLASTEIFVDFNLGVTGPTGGKSFQPTTLAAGQPYFVGFISTLGVGKSLSFTTANPVKNQLVGEAAGLLPGSVPVRNLEPRLGLGAGPIPFMEYLTPAGKACYIR